MQPDIQAEWKPEPALWTIQQASLYLNVCPNTIRNLIRNGELVGRRIGARVLVPFTSLESFLRRDHSTGQSKSEKGETK
jgi:excisionase family DNA binding protein